MNPNPNCSRCEKSELACAYVAQALSPDEVAAAEAHIASCAGCQRELESLGPVLDRFVSWPTDVLRPPTSLQERLALRIAEETREPPIGRGRAASARGRAVDQRAQAGAGRLQLWCAWSVDESVWSETGCTCVLVTSTEDLLR
jgi:Putative zinc-finger